MLGIERIKNQVMNCLPSGDGEAKFVTPLACFNALDEIHKSRICFACGVEAQQMVVSACSVVKGFTQQRGPTLHSI